MAGLPDKQSFLLEPPPASYNCPNCRARHVVVKFDKKEKKNNFKYFEVIVKYLTAKFVSFFSLLLREDILIVFDFTYSLECIYYPNNRLIEISNLGLVTYSSNSYLRLAAKMDRLTLLVIRASKPLFKEL